MVWLVAVALAGQNEPTPVRIIAYSDGPNATTRINSYPVRVLTGSPNLIAGKVVVRDVASSQSRYDIVNASPDGRFIAVGSSKRNETQVLDGATLSTRFKLSTAELRSVKWSQDSRYLGLVDESATFSIIDTKLGKIIARIGEVHQFWWDGSDRTIVGKWHEGGRTMSMKESRNNPHPGHLDLAEYAMKSRNRRPISWEEGFRRLTGARPTWATKPMLEDLFESYSIYCTNFGRGRLVIPEWIDKGGHGGRHVADLVWMQGRKLIIRRVAPPEDGSEVRWAGLRSLGYVGMFADSPEILPDGGTTILRIDLPSMRRTWWVTPQNLGRSQVIWK